MKLKTLIVALTFFLLLSIFAIPAFAQPKNVLFVCKGNIMRSVIAEKLFEKMLSEKGLASEYIVSSRGLQGTPGWPVLPTHGNLKYYNKASGKAIWEQVQPSLKELGIEEEMKANKATVVTVEDIQSADLVVALNQDVLSDSKWGMTTQFPTYSKKMMLFTELVGSDEGIADAYDSKEKGNKYERVVLKIADVLKKGYNNLIKRLSSPQ